VERPVRDHGIHARHKRRHKVTADSRHGLPVAADLPDRNFTPAAPSGVRAPDITYLWGDEGWLYPAIVPGLSDREIAGWSPKPRMAADIVAGAPATARFRKRPAPGSMYFPGRGSQYAGHAFRGKLQEYGMVCPMGRKGKTAGTTRRHKASPTVSRTGGRVASAAPRTTT